MLCRFEEFSPDIPANRLLKSALLAGLRTGALDEAPAKRCRRLLARFEGVSEVVRADLDVQLTRELRSYAAAVQLAKHVLRGINRSLTEGAESAWCFLWRTPEAVEAGIREIVRSELGPGCRVHKTTASHGELTFNPDLVIGSGAVGDVKYSVDSGGWRRSDVNQLLAFATAFAVTDTLLVNFSPVRLLPRTETVTPVHLTRIAWNVGETVKAAEQSFRHDVRKWFAVQAAPTLSALA
jgi:5-methylcytosine-specific restriction endonuclease McrBC regulatory subunit McrC